MVVARCLGGGTVRRDTNISNGLQTATAYTPNETHAEGALNPPRGLGSGAAGLEALPLGSRANRPGAVGVGPKRPPPCDLYVARPYSAAPLELLTSVN
jgi:hypothetical protein